MSDLDWDGTEKRDVLCLKSKSAWRRLLSRTALDRSKFFENLQFISVAKAGLDSISVFIENCPGLEWLDVHSNYIEDLPTPEILAQTPKLRVLNLHNNGIYRVQNLNNLIGLVSLQALTLYNCPITERSGYRHHVVNTIWTLKALDHYVLSDEEIIEDAQFFNENFKPLSEQMRVNLCPSNISRYSFKKIFRHINAISLHFSPVTILQRFIRGHLTRKRLREKGVKVKVVQCQRKGRNLLSPKWKLPFGKVEIDYQKLKLLKSQSQGEKVEKDFFSQMIWPDLIENNLEHGLNGKVQKIRSSGPLVNVLKSVRAKEMAEIERKERSEQRSKNEKQLLIENLNKRKQYQEEKEKIASEKSLKNEFVQKLNRSLDAARAVDAAYAYKERQNKFGKLVELNQKIKSDEKDGRKRTVEFKTQYRLQAEKGRAETLELEALVRAQRQVEVSEKSKAVKEKVVAKNEAKKAAEWSEKNAKKFSEYFLKLEKELIRYNVTANRTNYTKKRKATKSQLKDELARGSEQMKEKQKNALEKILRRNHRDKIRIESLHKAALERHRTRAQQSHKHIKLMNNGNKTSMSLPVCQPVDNS